MAQRFVNYLFVSMLVLVALTIVSACTIDTSDVSLELRSETDGYDDSITAEDDSYIDIQFLFEIDDVSGSDCPDDIYARGLIYRKGNDGNWVQFDTVSEKDKRLDEDNFEFEWGNEFKINDAYEDYKVVMILTDTADNSLDNNIIVEEATVEVERNSCSEIELTTKDFSIEEGESLIKLFKIRNNSNRDFEIDEISITFDDDSIIDDVTLDYDDVVEAEDSMDVEVEIEADYLSKDDDTTGTFTVSGTLGSRECSEDDIDQETFDVEVDNVSSSNNDDDDDDEDDDYDADSDYDYTRKSDCEDLSIVAHNFSLNEGSETTQVFYLQNEASKKFEITAISLTSNGVQLSEYYTEKYVYSDEIGDIMIKAKAQNVFSSTTYNNSIMVKGVFSDGKTCSFDNIQRDSFSVNVVDTTSNPVSFASCNSFSISAAESVSIENYGTIPFTITNGTGKRADIYVEGDVSVTPTLISLPANSAISRELNVSILDARGEVIFRPVIEGCNPNSKRITIINKAKGELASLEMTTELTDDANNANLTVEINNPTTKIFSGALSLDLPNWYFADSKEVVVTPGNNSFVFNLRKTENASAGNGTVTFATANGNVKTEFSVGSNGFSGLFALGGGLYSLWVLLLILIVVILVVGLFSSGKEEKQEWQES